MRPHRSAERGHPPAVVELTTVFLSTTSRRSSVLHRHRDEVAAVIVDPHDERRHRASRRGLLEGLRDTAHRQGALLIFDEVKTGATIARRDERFGVTPDSSSRQGNRRRASCGAIGGRAT